MCRSTFLAVKANLQTVPSIDDFALLWLQDLCRIARSAGFDTAEALKEVAALSNTKNKYGMGSTQKMLLDAAQAAK